MRPSFATTILLLLTAFTALTTALAGSREPESLTALERTDRRANTPEEIWTATVRDNR
jgi:hypothetical protein